MSYLCLLALPTFTVPLLAPSPHRRAATPLFHRLPTDSSLSVVLTDGRTDGRPGNTGCRKRVFNERARAHVELLFLSSRRRAAVTVRVVKFSESKPSLARSLAGKSLLFFPLLVDFVHRYQLGARNTMCMDHTRRLEPGKKLRLHLRLETGRIFAVLFVVMSGLHASM